MEIATADSWYRTDSRADGVTHVFEPHIREFFRCNIWHVRGRDQDLLVDSGMGVVSLREQVPLVTRRQLLAVATHTHFDHIGNHAEFSARAVHAREADILDAPTRENTSANQYVGDDMFTALPPAPYQSARYSVDAAPATRLLEDGDIVDLGNRHFEVLHTPGHSPGSISLWEATTGMLFSGDVVYDGPLIDGDYPGCAPEYIASMARLAELPVNVVYGGHYPSYGRERHREIIHAWLQDHG